MKLKRFITEAEQATLLKLYDDKTLYKDFRYNQTVDNKTSKECITKILKSTIVEFSKFSYLTFSRDGEKAIVFDYNWNYETNDMCFIGTGGITINELKNGFEREG